MKKISVLFCLLCFGFASPILAQESFKWKEMNTFHSTAMLSFHGAEEGKLQPARDSAAAMLQKAITWQGPLYQPVRKLRKLKPFYNNWLRNVLP